jgi:hypothetical protein
MKLLSVTFISYRIFIGVLTDNTPLSPSPVRFALPSVAVVYAGRRASPNFQAL